MDKNVILQGDCLEVLKSLPDCSINCCVTSPPYFGLRDYGTGSWVGGDPNCDHAEAKIPTRFDYKIDELQQHNKGSDVKLYKKVCPTCGAVREDKQIGLEDTPEDFINKLVDIFREVKRVLKDDGTLWVNMGDSYMSNTFSNRNFIDDGGRGGNKPVLKKNNPTDSLKVKDLIGIPWMLAFALRKDGWYLRQDIIWHKSCAMPESVKDRCTKSHEYVFLLSKSSKYYFDYKAIQETAVSSDTSQYKNIENFHVDYDDADGEAADEQSANNEGKRNKRDVWTVNPSHYKEAHFATFPEALIEPMILAGCPEDGIVLDTFMGSGTTAVVAKKHHRNYVGIELNPEYIKIAENRIDSTFVQNRLF